MFFGAYFLTTNACLARNCTVCGGVLRRPLAKRKVVGCFTFRFFENYLQTMLAEYHSFVVGYQNDDDW